MKSVAVILACLIPGTTLYGQVMNTPLTFAPTISSDIEPFVIFTDLDTGVIAWRDDHFSGSIQNINIQHLSLAEPSASWGAGDTLPDGSTVSELTIEMATSRSGNGLVAAVAGENDQEVEFFALLKSDSLLGPLETEYVLMATHPALGFSKVPNPRLRLLMLAPDLSIFPQTQLKTSILDPLQFNGMVGLVETLDENEQTIAVPFAIANSRIMGGMTFFIPPDLIQMGINPNANVFRASCQVPTLTKLPDVDRSFIFPVSETAPVVNEQVWNYPERSNIGNLKFDLQVSEDQTTVTTVLDLNSWKEWARNDTLVYSARSIGRGEDDSIMNLESVSLLSDSAFGRQTWASLGAVRVDPTSPIPAITATTMWFSGPVNLNTVSVDMNKGDADGSGSVDRDDALAFFSFFTDMPPRTGWLEDQADMDGDGDVDYKDRELFTERLAIADFILNNPANPKKSDKQESLPTIRYEINHWNPGIGFLDWFDVEFPGISGYSPFGGSDIRAVSQDRHLIILNGFDNVGGFSSKSEQALLLFNPENGYSILAETFDADLNTTDTTQGLFFNSLSPVDDQGRFLLSSQEKIGDERTFRLFLGDLDNTPVIIPPPPRQGPRQNWWRLD